MISPLRFDTNYRDFWSEYNSMAAAEYDRIAAAGCYAPRYYHAPRNSEELILGPGGYLKYSLVIPGGSWILGYYHTTSTGAGANPSFLVQITDIGLNHRFFSTPVPEKFLSNALLTTYPSLLCKPYPVVDPGSFLVEFYQPNATTNRCQLTFLVAEVDPLLVKS